MDPSKRLSHAVLLGKIDDVNATTLRDFFVSYEKAACENGYSVNQVHALLTQLLQLILDQLTTPFTFQHYHQAIRHPFDYYQFGLDLIRPLIVFERSTVLGLDNLVSIEKSLNKGENVVLLGNHQTEPDPQAISLLLEKTYPNIAEGMIFVAGHRVTSDPLAVPLSKGRNLLCIYSKRHIENPPEQREEKLNYNRRTMMQMAALLNEGGKCIYVAPSGGRDRANEQGVVTVAPFDPQSIEMFRLMAKQAECSTHFHPLTLSTFDLLPPPSGIKKTLGEHRCAQSTAIHLHFGPALDLDNFPGSDDPDKHERRKKRAEYIGTMIARKYAEITNTG